MNPLAAIRDLLTTFGENAQENVRVERGDYDVLAQKQKMAQSQARLALEERLAAIQERLGQAKATGAERDLATEEAMGTPEEVAARGLAESGQRSHLLGAQVTGAEETNKPLPLPPDVARLTGRKAGEMVSYREYQQLTDLAQTKMQTGATITAAGIRSGQADSDRLDSVVDGYVWNIQQSSDPERALSAVPTRNGIRDRVIAALHETGAHPVSLKIRQANGEAQAASAALRKIGTAMERYLNAKLTGDPRELTDAATIFDAERQAFSTLVGRSLGERGVFTNQDAARFQRLLGLGLVRSRLQPGAARQILAEAKGIVEEARRRKVGALSGQSGAEGGGNDVDALVNHFSEKYK